MVRLDVNTHANIILTARLERLNRSAFPSAVRSTLSDAAFAMKRVNILASATANMKVKNPTFFRKYTGVKRAAGFNVSSMYSEVGFSPLNETKSKKALEGMESNEVGGTDNDGGMYVGKTRTSKGLVKRNARFNRNNVSKARTKSNVARMAVSLKENKQVFINTSKGRFLVKVRSIDKGSDGKRDIKLDFLMRHRKDHPAKSKATHFVKEAALVTAYQIEGFYLKNATFQFNRALMGRR